VIDLIEFGGKKYPKFQTEGNSAQFAMAFAKHVCVGDGVDIGCNRPEWAFPGARPIDKIFDDGYDAYNLPGNSYDYIFSSHCLEHLPDWVSAMEYWTESLRVGGVLFLYLPDVSQKYWRPWYNHKHLHVFTPEIIKTFLEDKGYIDIFVSGIDMNNSFIVMATRML